MMLGGCTSNCHEHVTVEVVAESLGISLVAGFYLCMEQHIACKQDEDDDELWVCLPDLQRYLQDPPGFIFHPDYPYQFDPYASEGKQDLRDLGDLL